MWQLPQKIQCLWSHSHSILDTSQQVIVTSVRAKMVTFAICVDGSTITIRHSASSLNGEDPTETKLHNPMYLVGASNSVNQDRVKSMLKASWHDKQKDIINKVEMSIDSPHYWKHLRLWGECPLDDSVKCWQLKCWSKKEASFILWYLYIVWGHFLYSTACLMKIWPRTIYNWRHSVR